MRSRARFHHQTKQAAECDNCIRPFGVITQPKGFATVNVKAIDLTLSKAIRSAFPCSGTTGLLCHLLMTTYQHTLRSSVLFLLWHVGLVSTFTFQRARQSHVTRRPLCLDGDSWNDAHLARGLDEVREPDATELLESEQEAVVDAHDTLDAGMEAAAEERAVMWAAEMTHHMKNHPPRGRPGTDRRDEWNDAHLAHGIADVHEEDATELRESEEMAAVDAHDAPDAGMEAAAEEWAVMLAAEFTHKLKSEKPKTRE